MQNRHLMIVYDMNLMKHSLSTFDFIAKHKIKIWRVATSVYHISTEPNKAV